jgi:hypothetical protein
MGRVIVGAVLSPPVRKRGSWFPTTTTSYYCYDSANNRSAQEVPIVTGSNTTTTNTTYNYNNLDQVTSTTGALVGSFGYDAVGNRTTETIATATNTCTYDAENRLVELVRHPHPAQNRP